MRATVCARVSGAESALQQEARRYRGKAGKKSACVCVCVRVGAGGVYIVHPLLTQNISTKSLWSVNCKCIIHHCSAAVCHRTLCPDLHSARSFFAQPRRWHKESSPLAHMLLPRAHAWSQKGGKNTQWPSSFTRMDVQAVSGVIITACFWSEQQFWAQLMWKSRPAARKVKNK